METQISKKIGAQEKRLCCIDLFYTARLGGGKSFIRGKSYNVSRYTPLTLIDERGINNVPGDFACFFSQKTNI